MLELEDKVWLVAFESMSFAVVAGSTRYGNAMGPEIRESEDRYYCI